MNSHVKKKACNQSHDLDGIHDSLDSQSCYSSLSEICDKKITRLYHNKLNCLLINVIFPTTVIRSTQTKRPWIAGDRKLAYILWQFVP